MLSISSGTWADGPVELNMRSAYSLTNALLLVLVSVYCMAITAHETDRRSRLYSGFKLTSRARAL